MPTPTIGEIIQTIFSDDKILDLLEGRGWDAEIETMKEEELSILKNRDNTFKIRQWDSPRLLMQCIVYDGKVVYLIRGAQGNGLFEHPEVYDTGHWEEELRKFYRPSTQSK